MKIHHYYTQDECYRAIIFQNGMHVWKAWIKGNLPNMNTNQVSKPTEKQNETETLQKL